MDNARSTSFDERYLRQLQLPGFGVEAQAKLAAAKVLIVGLGGLGVPVAQYLAGMGVGSLGLLDGDNINLSNLHRQILYQEQEVGLPKATVALSRLKALNSNIHLTAHPEFLSVSNALDLINDYDIIVDATDNFSVRYLINDACVLLKKPFVYGSVHQYEGHVSVFNVQRGPTYRCLYPTPPTTHEIPDCNLAGVLGVVPGMIGCRQALEVIKLITGIGKSLSGYLQIFDFLNDEQYKIKLHANPKNQEIERLQASYELSQGTNVVNQITTQILGEWQEDGREILLLDVREVHEYDAGHLPHAVNLPLSEWPDRALPLPSSQRIVLYCQKGSRSAKASRFIQAHQPSLSFFELAGGYDAWLKRIPS